MKTTLSAMMRSAVAERRERDRDATLRRLRPVEPPPLGGLNQKLRNHWIASKR